MDACMKICRDIITETKEKSIEETLEIITRHVTEFVATVNTKYNTIDVDDDDNRFSLTDGGDLYLDELFDAKEISKQDIILYYFILAINAYIEMKPKTKIGGRRKSSLAKRIRNKYRKMYCRRKKLHYFL